LPSSIGGRRVLQIGEKLPDFASHAFSDWKANRSELAKHGALSVGPEEKIC
jgi:hypothetical protein